jgi:hypothetical protein
MSEMKAPLPTPDAGPGPVEQAKETTQEAVERTKGQLRAQVDERSTQAGEKVTSAASDVRSVGEHLRSQGKEEAAKVADQTAQRAEKLGGYLRESGPDRILADVEDIARRRPWAVLAGGVLVGFAASRFLKASSQKRYRSSTEPGTM